MRKLLFTLLLASGLAQATPDAQQLLAASDAIRNPGQAFSLDNTLIEYRNGREQGQTQLQIYARPASDSGQYRNLIRFLAPLRDAGKLMLRNGNELWFYDPASKASVRISPQQRLLGQAANGDVMTVNLARDYRARLDGEETVQDGERQPRASYRLVLQASHDDVTYPRITLWVDAANSRPIKGQFYSDSGRLLKTAFYRRYQLQLGVQRPSETVIIDGLDPGWMTVMRTGNLAARDIPEVWLQRDYLPRFRAE
jgi:outer membrane lipoprotein-sorting protein